MAAGQSVELRATAPASTRLSSTSCGQSPHMLRGASQLSRKWEEKCRHSVLPSIAARLDHCRHSMHEQYTPAYPLRVLVVPPPP